VALPEIDWNQPASGSRAGPHILRKPKIFSPRLLHSALVSLLLTTAAVTSAGVSAATASPADHTGGTVRYLVKYAPGTDVASQTETLRSRNIPVGRTFSAALRGAVVTATAAQAADLRRSAQVAAVEVDASVTVAETQQDAPWGLDRVDQRALPLSGSYTSAGSGAGVSAYVIDTGVLASHTEFGGRVAAGWTAIADGKGTSDCNGHGTHVAGTIAGKTYGVAKAATVIPVRVLGCNGSGYNSDVIAGLDWVASNHQTGTPAVANLSLGSTASALVDAAVQGAIDDGVTVVVAAGNSAADACNSSPARVHDAITVAASDSTDRQASFSNFGSCVDLYAPGVAIKSAGITSTTATVTMSGTSMASPHTAGAAAAILSLSPALTPAAVSSGLIAGSTPNVVTAASPGTPNRLLFAGPSAPALNSPTPATNATPTAPGAFTSLTPFRQLDTRDGTGAAAAGTVAPWATIRVKVTGRGGIPAAGVSAVAVNVTVTSPGTAGNITVYAGGTTQPGTSNLNFTAGQTIPNLVNSPVGTDGTIALTNNSGSTVHLIADTAGYYLSLGS
jgi:subtilisin family serine protease